MNNLFPSVFEMVTILGMGACTYFTRIVGLLWLRKYQLSSRMRAVLESSPCCVMVAVVAPYFMTTDIKMLIALGATIVMAFKLNLGLTICMSVVLMAILQQLP